MIHFRKGAKFCGFSSSSGPLQSNFIEDADISSAVCGVRLSVPYCLKYTQPSIHMFLGIEIYICNQPWQIYIVLDYSLAMLYLVLFCSGFRFRFRCAGK
jgi:hypothetical protein